ncbi:MAG: translation elongation factor Ts [Acidobacteria bacterium]|nr:MAG: translation elongation factor Ts [Acidobacteriota bacterium]TDI11849.1 MAG: translation elongation factor Ts [Acidobacteriota bacterium]TDI17680.1 MAG: translation elongation factor Ts [Acidobacteriota bacterium]
MAISAEQVKALRDQTGAGMMECKKALLEADGDLEKAVTLLRERGLAAAAKRADRQTREGIIGHYIHSGGRLGVLAEVNCETDFVAATEEFQGLVRDIAMQIAASNPSYVRREDVRQEEIEREKEIYHNQAQSTGKPEKIMERIVEGKLNKYYSEVCLYEQPFIKDPELTVEELIKAKIAVLKENITVKRFARFKVGE